MKMKGLFTLAVLLTSSLAGAANGTGKKLEDKYYAGLNFGAGWGGGLKIKPGIVLGYHHDKNSKFELEVLTDISETFAEKGKKMGASLLANYRFYPDLDIDPVKLYVSGGLGGYLQVMPFGFGDSGTGADGAAEGKASLVDKILGSISYKLKVGVDYEITPQIVGAVGVTAGGQLSGLKAAEIPDAILEVGVRYNF